MSTFRPTYVAQTETHLLEHAPLCLMVIVRHLPLWNDQGGFFMQIMNAQHIHYSIGDRTILDIKELTIHHRDRIGLIGKNGEGKSLLLNYLVGNTDETPIVDFFGSVGFFQQLNHHIEFGDSWNHLSGGEKTQAKLDEIFHQNHDLLFLDEPTNNLDWNRIEDLEARLKAFKGAFLIVSHDRKLLDAVCTKIIDLNNGEITEYKGNFSDYEEAKNLKVKQQYEEHESYLKEKKRLTDRMRQKEQQAKGMRKPPARMGNSEWQLYKNKAAGKQKKVERVSKVIQDRIDRLEKVDKPFEWDDIKMDYVLSEPIHRKQVLMAKKLTKTINERKLYEIESLKLPTGSKTAFIGPNGSGKTTLIQQLLSMDGEIDIPKQVKIGHFEQALEKLPEDKSVLEYVQKDSHLPQHLVRIILGRLRFFEEDVHKRIGVLSGGERVKTALAKLLTGDYNVLILDEPTNHLDLEAISALEGLIRDYPGTALYVTHDRRFVEKTADHLWILDKETVSMFSGSLQEWYKSLEQPTVVDEDSYDLMALETKLTELISRLSMPGPNDNMQLLEQQYEETLKRIQQKKSAT